MKFDITDIILLGLFIYSWISVVSMVANVIKGFVLLKKARDSGEYIVNGVSAVYSVKNYIFAILVELFFLIFFCRTLFKFRFVINFSLMFIVVISPVLCNLIIHTIAIFREKYVYLTSKGLVYFLGCFEFSKCQFSWEATNSQGELSNKLHIYKPKNKFPFTVIFDYDADIAHKITDENSYL